MEYGLIDEYHLMVFPVVLGRGRRLFDGAGASTFVTFFDGYDGISAHLDLRAPSGQPLVAEPYENATRFQSGDPLLPQLAFSYDHRGCNIITGRFDVLEATYGPYNYIQKFHATFERSEALILGPVLIETRSSWPAASEPQQRQRGCINGRATFAELRQR
jgi:hypothetical protein